MWFFQDYYKYKYTGEMKNGRPNGNGFASDEKMLQMVNI